MILNLDKANWKRVALGDVATASREKVDPASGDVKRYIAGEHMNTNVLKIHRWGEVGEGYLGPAFHRRFRPGQVLYGSRRTYLRKVAVADFDGVTANTTFVVESKDQAHLLQAFLPFVMASESFHNFAVRESKGSVNPYVNWSDIARYEFDLAPIGEQKRMTDLLWAVEASREAARARLHAAERVEKKLLEGMVHSDWPYATVSELGNVQLGQQLHPKYRVGPKVRPYLRVANVGDNCLRLDDVASMDFSDPGAEKFRLEPGDVLLNEGQSLELVGRCAMFRGEIPDCYMQKTLLRFRAGAEIVPEFALAWFRRCFYLGHFAEMAKRTTSMAHLTAVRFSAMPMPCPPMADQRAVVELVESVGGMLAAAREELHATESLRSSLLTEVFGGN
ncbi:restriction endonuclease subunit S [Micromonospora sp. LA-10]|uniref:restriction endonuclease subunit S n=1 Tax=Micromonospora sp. LA-10 TaxID=3446364 RepID=UPI003F72DAEE